MLKAILFGETPVSSPYLKSAPGNPARLRAAYTTTSTSEATTYVRTMERSTSPASTLLLRDLRRSGSLFSGR